MLRIVEINKLFAAHV